MIAGTSTVSATTWLSVTPTRTFEPTLSFPTVFSSPHLQARADQIPECCPNKVVVHLSTTVVIPDYGLYYNVPIESFRPKYHALDDGSLIAPPFIQDLVGANISLLVTGFITMLFVRNIIVTGDYIRRGKVKNKTLFHILFLSQILAPISFVPIIISYFNHLLNCTIVIILSCVAATLSLALLITGILGVKVYKCLNNSRFILVVLGIFQCASSGTIAMDVATMRGERRLSGSCVRVSNLLCTRIFVLIQLLESLFICCCFMYACWKSRGSTDARGRLSIQLSMEEPPTEAPEDTTEKPPTLRGWWDYVPNTQVAPVHQPPSNLKQASARRSTSRLFLTGFINRKSQKSRSATSKQPRHRISETPSDRHLIAHSDQTIHPYGRTSPTPSSLSRLGKLVPHMELFQKVMKDELLYTTFITGTCVVVAVLAVIGVNFKNGLTVSGWIALNWSVISLLAIHSFGRVVRRHERDALLQHPATCDAIVRRGNAIASARLSNRSKSRTSSEFSTDPGHRGGAINDMDNPFSDARRLDSSRISWHTPDFVPDSHSPPLGPPISEKSTTIPVFPPSPTSPSIYSTFPTSGRGTPVVPHQSSDGASGFSQSWLFDRTSLSTNGDGKSEKDSS